MENEVVAPDTIDPTPPEPEIKTESAEVKAEPKAEPKKYVRGDTLPRSTGWRNCLPAATSNRCARS